MKIQVTSYSEKSRKYSSYKCKVGTIAPNWLNRRFESSDPLQKIVTDTTEFKYYELDENGSLHIKKMYLNPYIDLYNRDVIRFAIFH